MPGSRSCTVSCSRDPCELAGGNWFASPRRVHHPEWVSPSRSVPVVPDASVVTRLLQEQAPHLADLFVSESGASGSSNWVFRLGDDLAIRLPRSDDYVADLANEVRWLPRLASALPVAVPDVVAVGRPSEAFTRPWAVVSWVEGELPLALDGPQQERLAASLGSFLQDLHAVDTGDVAAGPERWGYRCGEPVTDTIDRWADEAAAELADQFDPARVREAWQLLRDVPAATHAPCWVHTDLSEENLLVDQNGHLAGVIDFGGVGVGDRSVDLLYAWSMFDASARGVLRASSGVDDGTWARGRAWAFVGPGLLTIAHYRDTMPARTERLTAMVETIAADVGVCLR